MKATSLGWASWKKLTVAAVIGVAVGAYVATTKLAHDAPLMAWDTVAILFVGWMLATVLRYNAEQTKMHALQENPGRASADALLIFASIASLGAVGVVVFNTGHAHGAFRAVDIALALLSVVVSWSVVHTLYLLKYARLYYGTPEGGIEFNGQNRPQYSDFAYLAFTVGMTFQISDTALQTKELRATVLKQALLSYVFGTVIIATTINTIVSLSS